MKKIYKDLKIRVIFTNRNENILTGVGSPEPSTIVDEYDNTEEDIFY